jgi:replication-associated recombination protein RarA
MKQEKIPLTEKYRPQAFQDLVLPSPHGLGAAVRFIDNPSRSRWMLVGKSGLGKTSLAEIMARACADPMCTEHFVGPDLDSTQVSKIVSATRTSPLFGRFYCYVCHEADAIPPGGQVRLLSALEDPAPAIWIFTSNEEAENWEPRFLSRFTVLQFSNQGLADPATRWLCRISILEGMELSYAEGEKIIRASKNNLRGALQRLEVILGDYHDSRRIILPAVATLIPVNLPLLSAPI